MKSDNLARKIKPSFLEQYKSHFRGRQDVVPEFWEHLDRKGYMPICQNRLNQNKCQIVKGIKSPCKTCNYKEYAPLTDELLQEHLAGKTILGVYPLLPDNSCYFIAGDFDNHNGDRNPLVDVKAYFEACQSQKIPCYILRSRSGAGYHAYIFFQEPVPAWKARRVAFYLLKQGGVIGPEVELSSFDRLFPNQDHLTKEKAIGNLIALPFQGEAIKKGNTVFLDPATGFTTPYPDQLFVLETIAYSSEAELDRIINEEGLQQEKSTPTSRSTIDIIPTNGIERLLQCDFIRWSKDHQHSVGEPLWFAMLSNVARVSPRGYDWGHLFSKGHPKYSYQETEEKIRRALNDTGPHTCQYIKENGFNCGKECGVKSPIALLHKHDKEPALDLDKAKAITAAIIELSHKEPVKVIQEIRSNQKFMGALVLLADKDKDQFEDALKQMEANNVPAEELDALAVDVELAVEKLRHSRLPKIIDMLPNAPIDENLVLPKNWIISYKHGLQKIVEIRKPGEEEPEEEIVEVIYSPIVISRRMVDVIDNRETVRLCFYRDGRWNFLDVEKSQIATTRNITGLADYGVPVNSLSCKYLVEYLANFEKVNIGVIPLGRSSRHLGWQDDYSGFLWGRDYLQYENLGTTDEGDLSSKNQADKISFRGSDSGEEQVAAGFHKQGTYEAWVNVVNQLFPYPRVIAGVYFSLATPLLHILDAANFTVDWAGGTSTGKTTTLRIASSSWGNPDERSSKSVLFSWDVSKVWIERTAAILNGLPLFLDDTKLAGKGKFKGSGNALISDILYTIAEGRGRGRGSVSGTQHTGTWRTILLSTGEQSAVDFSVGDGGTRARVISLWGPPFGNGDENLGAFVWHINLTIKENYGHAGPRLIHFILANREQWPVWKKEYQDLQKYFAQKAGDNPVADRVSGYFAFLATVIPIVHAALPELKRDINPQAILDQLWEAAIIVAEEADRAIAALQVAYDYAVAHQDEFWNINQKDTYQPAGGWAGRWDIPSWSLIGFNSFKLETILQNAGFDVAAIIKTWKDRGYLDTDKTGRGKQMRVNNAQTYLYCLKRSDIERVLKIHDVEEN